MSLHEHKRGREQAWKELNITKSEVRLWLALIDALIVCVNRRHANPIGMPIVEKCVYANTISLPIVYDVLSWKFKLIMSHIAMEDMHGSVLICIDN